MSRLDAAAVYIRKSHQGNWDLHVQFEGSESFTSAQAERAADRLPTDLAPVSSEMVRLGELRRLRSMLLRTFATSDAVVVAIVHPCFQTIADPARLGEIDGIDILADLGSGLVYVRGDGSMALHARLSDLGIPVAFLALPESQKRDLDVFGAMDQNAADIVRRLKDEFDPERMFNPGRFVSFL